MKGYAINILAMTLAFAVGWAAFAIKPRAVKISAEDRRVEEYAVYSALINALFANDETKVLIQDLTISHFFDDNKTSEADFNSRDLPSAISSDTLDDYKVVDQHINVLTTNFVLKNNYLLLGADERKQWFQSTETIRSFHLKYPGSGSIILLSRVGFNHKMDQALLWEWGYCGGDCGRGGFYLFRKENGVWKLKGSKIWIS
jgi:hypothetical protein